MARIQNAKIVVWLMPEDKKDFTEACKKNAVNPSELIRKWVNEYAKKNIDVKE